VTLFSGSKGTTLLVPRITLVCSAFPWLNSRIPGKPNRWHAVALVFVNVNRRPTLPAAPLDAGGASESWRRSQRCVAAAAAYGVAPARATPTPAARSAAPAATAAAPVTMNRLLISSPPGEVGTRPHPRRRTSPFGHGS